MSYPGGKGSPGVVQKIINQIPPHRTYIELFLGSGQVMRNKRPAEHNIGVEIDQSVIDQHWGNPPHDHTILCDDAISFLLANENVLNTAETFIYLDPPYLFDVRSSKTKIYDHEFGTIDQHSTLLKILTSLECNVAISGYPSSIYNEVLLGDWRSISYTTRTRGGKSVEEKLWMNYAEPLELHDYRFLGENFRERERVKRIQKRWIARMARLPMLERYAVLSMFNNWFRSVSFESDDAAVRSSS